MRARRFAIATVAAAFLAVAAASPASANLAWCVYDPPVKVVSPAGSNLLVNTYVYYPKVSKHIAPRVTVEASADASSTGGTTITVRVYVPRGDGTIHVVVTSQRYKITEEQDGAEGSVMTFTLDVPND